MVDNVAAAATAQASHSCLSDEWQFTNWTHPRQPKEWSKKSTARPWSEVRFVFSERKSYKLNWNCISVFSLSLSLSLFLAHHFMNVWVFLFLFVALIRGVLKKILWVVRVLVSLRVSNCLSEHKRHGEGKGHCPSVCLCVRLRLHNPRLIRSSCRVWLTSCFALLTWVIDQLINYVGQEK